MRKVSDLTTRVDFESSLTRKTTPEANETNIINNNRMMNNLNNVVAMVGSCSKFDNSITSYSNEVSR